MEGNRRVLEPGKKKRLRLLIILMSTLVMINFICAAGILYFQLERTITVSITGSGTSSIDFSILTDFNDFAIDTSGEGAIGSDALCLDLRGSAQEDNSITVKVLFDEEITDLTQGECLNFETDCLLIFQYHPESAPGSPITLTNGTELFLKGDTPGGDSMHTFIVSYDCLHNSCDQMRTVDFQLVEI